MSSKHMKSLIQDLMGSTPKKSSKAKNPTIQAECKTITPKSQNSLKLPNISHSSTMTNSMHELKLQAIKNFKGCKKDKNVTANQVMEEIFGDKGVIIETSISEFDARVKSLLGMYSKLFIKKSLQQIFQELKDIVVEHALQHELMRFVNESDPHYHDVMHAFDKLINAKNSKDFVKISKDFSNISKFYSQWKDFSARVGRYLVKPRDLTNLKIKHAATGEGLKSTTVSPHNIQVIIISCVSPFPKK